MTRYTLTVTLDSPTEFEDDEQLYLQITNAMRYQLMQGGCTLVGVVRERPHLKGPPDARQFALSISDERGAWNGRGPIITLHASQATAEAAVTEYVSANWESEIGDDQCPKTAVKR